MSKRRPRRIKGMRTHHLKKFHSEVVNTGTTINQERMGTYYHRVKSMSQPVPETKTTCPGYVFSSRAEVEAKLNQTLRMQWSEKMSFVFLLNKPDERVSMFWSGSQAFLVRELPAKNVVLRSIIYSSPTRARERFKERRVTWVEAEDILAPGSPSPS